MDIFKIKSDLPITEYAPYWNISLGNAVWEESEKIDKIRNWLIANEEDIKKMYPPLNDGGTGLGSDSVTSRFGRYNLFDFASEVPEITDLLNFIRLSYINFVHKDFTHKQELVIISWFNVVKDGQKIKEHCHSANKDSYLSANMHLDNYPTNTIYRSPYEPFVEYPFKNVKGGFTIFPSYVPHKTNEYAESDAPRVSIACDLRLPTTVPPDNMLKERVFMNPEIFNQLMGRL